MPDFVPTAATAERGERQAADLAALRAELDRLDDDIHDALMRRAEVVARIATDGGKGRVKLRPGREAAILRRLLARHAGDYPRSALVRIWRELLAGSTAMQAPFAVAVCEPGHDGEHVACAREQFGVLTPMRAHADPHAALAEVASGRATVAVLPLPGAGGAAAPWWTELLRPAQPRLFVVARLPFWAPRPEGAPSAKALVVATIVPDPTGHDRSLLGLAPADGRGLPGVSAALEAADLVAGAVLLDEQRASPGTFALLDVAGHVGVADHRLALLEAAGMRPVALGAYAIPVDGGLA